MLDEIESSKDDYHRALAASKDGILELYLKIEFTSCFVNSYSVAGLKAWLRSMLREVAFNEFKEVAYM